MSDPEASRVLALLRQYGHNTTSFQVLEPGLSYWFDDDGRGEPDAGPGADRGCVAYAHVGGAYVAAGAPISAPEREGEVAQRFMAFAKERSKRVRFFAIERESIADAGLALMHMGEQPMWRPSAWPDVLRAKRSLREQLRRARAKGVSVRRAGTDELIDPDSALRHSLDELIADWKNSRVMAPMGFVVQIDIYTYIAERRVFVAERDEELVGLLAAVPLYARNGWFFEDVLRHTRAPNGTMELLFDAAMRAAHEADIECVTYGLAPLANTPSPVMAAIRDHTRRLYHFDGLRAFKAKLMPESWHPVYLAHPPGERGARAVLDVLRAFAGGSLVRFGWATLRHQAALVTRVLAWLLVPWTLAMALSNSARWFPAPAIKVAWIAYDAVLFVLLLTLAHRWRRSLALLLSGAAALDVLVGTAQAALYNLPRGPDGPLSIDGAVVMLALLAPLFAAVFLWSCRDRATLYRPPPMVHRVLSAAQTDS